jgi:hypothetical protein
MDIPKMPKGYLLDFFGEEVPEGWEDVSEEWQGTVMDSDPKFPPLIRPVSWYLPHKVIRKL